MTTLEDAILLAVRAHRGQIDKAGKPYILHPLRVDEVTPPDVYGYLAAARRRRVSDATQHRRHREVKHFFSWLRRTGIVAENPFQKVPLIRLEDQIVEPLKAKEIERLLNTQDETTLLGARNKALTLFLLDTGIRASEAVSVDLGDVGLMGGRACILHGKGKKHGSWPSAWRSLRRLRAISA